MEKLAAVLIAAHVIADFFLQTDSIAYGKKRLHYLIFHGAIHAASSYLMLQAWICWQAPAFVLLTHSIIDFAKQRCRIETWKAFIVDQVMHVISLLLLAWLLVHFSWLPSFSGLGYKLLIASAGFVAAVRGAGFLVGLFTKTLIDENNLTIDGLRNGGKLIGQLERCLIFLFIFINQPAGIGFLVAAKSVLRFEEAKEQKLAEYILIGTLLSFSIAIALSFLTRWAIQL